MELGLVRDLAIEPGDALERDSRLSAEFVAVLDGELQVFVDLPSWERRMGDEGSSGPPVWRVRGGLGIWIPEGKRPWMESSAGAAVRVLTLPRQMFPTYRLIEFSHLWLQATERLREPPLAYSPEDESALLRVSNLELKAAWSLALSPPPPSGWLEAKAATLLSTSEPSLDEIAAIFELSRRSLDKRLRRQTGFGLVDYRKEAQLIEAVRLLFEGKTLDEIAERVGYSGRWAFLTAFRNRYGSTPKEFRRLYGPTRDLS